MSLSLCKEIFELSSVRAAAAAFSALATISIEDDGSCWMCAFSNCRYGDEITAREFENYVIDHMNGA